MMTATTNPMASPRPLLESNPLKPVPEDHQKSLVGGSSLTKEAKQRYIIVSNPSLVGWLHFRLLTCDLE